MHCLQYLILCLVVLASCTRPQSPLETDVIVLNVTRRGLWSLPNDTYVVTTDGSGPLSQTVPSGVTGSSDWSLDGQWIAFVAEEGSAIYIVRRDGSQRTQVTHHTALYGDVVWSPAGTHLAYYKRGEETERGIYVQDVTCIIDTETMCDSSPVLFAVGGETPDWSPDGQYIVYAHSPWSGEVIKKIRIGSVADPEEVVELLPERRCANPQWSPVGDKIALSCEIESEDKGRNQSAVYTVNADGSELTQLTAPESIRTIYLRPRWSPDGDQLAFNSARDDDLGQNICSLGCSDEILTTALYVMNADGTNIVRLSLRNDESIDAYIWVP
ncbi:MAG TPA: hypothetical protein PKH77_19805 [Anaerolineae bacterium]|nr:hypothetical protein [Anaerolineae bacterium]